MGTRADFYVGRGAHAEWLGSIAWDGYPEGIAPAVLGAITERQYRERVGAFFADRGDVSLPATGWPWPWENSQTTDYSYAFDGDRVWASCFGYAWFDPTQPEPEADDEADARDYDNKPTVFPTMKVDRAAMSGPRSGLIVVTPDGVL